MDVLEKHFEKKIRNIKDVLQEDDRVIIDDWIKFVNEKSFNDGINKGKKNAILTKGILLSISIISVLIGIITPISFSVAYYKNKPSVTSELIEQKYKSKIENLKKEYSLFNNYSFTEDFRTKTYFKEISDGSFCIKFNENADFVICQKR